VIETQHRGRDVAYPVLVDPSVTDTWQGQDGWDDRGQWTHWVNSGGFSFGTSGSSGAGRYIYSGPGTMYQGNTAQYQLPAWGQSFFSRADFYGPRLLFNSPGSYYDNHKFQLAAGIWSVPQGRWTAVGAWLSQFSSPTYSAVPDYSNTTSPDYRTGNRIVFELGSTASMGRAYWTEAFFSGVVLAQEDHNVPTVSTVQSSTANTWTDEPTTVTVSGTAQDVGLGLRYIDAYGPFGHVFRTLKDVENADPCDGTHLNRCKNTPVAVPTDNDFRWSTAAWPEGRNSIGIHATDVIGRQSPTQYAYVNVDRSQPTATLTGSLWDRRGQDLPAGTYQLTSNATDGTLSSAPAQRSGMRRLEIWVDGDLIDEADQACAAGSCSMQRTTAFRTADFPGGEHTVVVRAFDQLDHEKTTSFTVRTACCSSAAATWGSLSSLQEMMLGDVDADGADDLISRDRTTGALEVRLSNGAAFGGGASWGTLGTSYTAHVGDIDGDGDADLVGRRASDGQVVVLRSTGTGFASAAVWGNWPATLDVYLADVDQIEGDDLVGRNSSNGEVRVAPANANSFGASEVWATVDTSLDTRFADVDDDGMADLVTRNTATGAVSVRLSTQQAFDVAAAWGDWSASGTLRAYDMQADGQAELVSVDPANGTLRVAPSTGSRFVAAETWGQIAVPAPDILIADVNGDDNGDVVVRNASDALLVYTTSGTAPTIAAPDAYAPGAASDYDAEDEVPATGSGGTNGTGAPTCAGATGAEQRSDLRLAAQDDGVMLTGGDSSARTRLLERLRWAGASILRLNANWGHIQAAQNTMPGNTPRYNWNALDTAVTEAKCAGFDVYVTITGAAINRNDCNRYLWATSDPPLGCGNDDGTSSPSNQNRSSVTGVFPPAGQGRANRVAEYAEFVRAVVNRYSNPATTPTNRRVYVYGLWNEPNTYQFLRRDSSSTNPPRPLGDNDDDDDIIEREDRQGDGTDIAKLYRDLYEAGRTAGKQAAGSEAKYVRFNFGELSELNRGSVDTYEFIGHAASDDQNPLLVDGVAVHPYQHSTPPDKDREPGRYGIGGLGGERGLLYRVRDLRDKGRLRATNNTVPRLYITEFGYWIRRLNANVSFSTVHTEVERKAWLQAALRRSLSFARARDGRPRMVRWMTFYLGAEREPAATLRRFGPQTPAPARNLPGCDEDNNSGGAGRDVWDMGLFDPDDGAYTGRRCYGRIQKGQTQTPGTQLDLDYPQDRQAYCGIVQWARGHSGQGYVVSPGVC
jgi:hypothetical protein